MESHLCVLGSTAVGTETLKNLVLPGCGNITIVDDATVTDGDLGNNFFVTEADVGSSRAEVRATTPRSAHRARPVASYKCPGHLQVASRNER